MRYTGGMGIPGQKIVDRISELPEEDRAGIEDAALKYINRLAEIRAALARAEEDIKAGRVKAVDEVFDPLIAKYGPSGCRH